MPKDTGVCDTCKAGIFKPMLASVKLDGIRAIKDQGQLLSRTRTAIPNNFIRTWIERNLPDGVDGELLIHDESFNDVQSGVMSEDGEPDFYYALFDYVSCGSSEPFAQRYAKLQKMVAGLSPEAQDRIWVVPQIEMHDPKELAAFEERAVEDEYEGIMVREAAAPYKSGRSTLRSQGLLKWKRFEDSEAEVLDYFPLEHNANEGKRNVFGRTKRSHAKAGMEEMPLLGKILVKDIKTGQVFKVGSGFNAEEREELWKKRDSLKGKIITYKFQPAGVKEAPRFPRWKGFRDKRDMS